MDIWAKATASEESRLVFRPLEPTLETPLCIVWNRCQTFTPIAERFLKQQKESLFNAEQRTPQLDFFAIPLYHSAKNTA